MLLNRRGRNLGTKKAPTTLPEDCTLHALRYTAATILRELGCDLPTIQAITGHRTAEMARKYSEKRRRAKVAIARLNRARLAAFAQKTIWRMLILT